MCSIEAHNIDSVSHTSIKYGEYNGFHLEMFHEQLPLPVPCYDLLPVTDFTVDHHMDGLRVLPAPLS